MPHYVGLRGIVALVEQRLAAEGGECIGEAIAVVQPGWMPAFAAAPGAPDSDDLDADLVQP